jgi:hypothetical protein
MLIRRPLPVFAIALVLGACQSMLTADQQEKAPPPAASKTATAESSGAAKTVVVRERGESENSIPAPKGTAKTAKPRKSRKTPLPASPLSSTSCSPLRCRTRLRKPTPRQPKATAKPPTA